MTILSRLILPELKNHSITAPSAHIYSVMMIHSPLKSPLKNHSFTAPSDLILLGSDSLQCQHSNRTHRSGPKLPPPRKEHLCFQIYRKPSHATQCPKSRTLNEVIDLIIEIESFKQQCVIVKGVLQSERMEKRMVTIGVDQSLSNSAMY